MEYRSIKGFSGLGQAGVLIGMLGAGFILAAIVQAMILFGLLEPGQPLDQMGESLIAVTKNPAHADAMKLAQVLGTFCLFFLPAYFYSLITNGKNLFWLGFNKYLNVMQVVLAFAIIFSASLLAGPLADLSKKIIANFPQLNATALRMENAYNEQLMVMGVVKGIGGYIIALFVVAFFPAVFEEVMFRGAIQNLLVNWMRKPIVAIVISSLIFSLIHLSIYLFLSRFVLGMALGLLYHYSKNIWINIIAHFLNNAIAVTQLYLLTAAGKKIDMATMDPAIPWYVGLVGLLALFFLFKYFIKLSAGKVLAIQAKESLLREAVNPFPVQAMPHKKEDTWA